jgi:acyl-CoA thioesterase-1
VALLICGALPGAALTASGQSPGRGASPASSETRPGVQPHGAARAARAQAMAVIVALGDSLTAGLGVAPDEAYPALLTERLRQEGYPYRVVNAGVSGDTTAGGANRLDWILRSNPEIVIVALGANDGLRGQPPEATRANLAGIVDRLRAREIRVLLAGMHVPTSHGERYRRQFAAVFTEVGRRADGFMPFLLDGIATVPRLNQADGIHPNADGHRQIAERLWPYLKPLLRRS